MNAMDRVKMSKEPKPRLVSAAIRGQSLSISLSLSQPSSVDLDSGTTDE